MDEATVARMIENGELDEDKLMFQFSEEVDIPPGCTDISAVLNEAKVIGERRMVLKQAHYRFSLLSKVSYNSSMDFERYYRNLYDDIIEHHDIWFDKLYNVDNPNPTHAEFSTGILGTLCTILRQRGELEECSKVMVTYMEVLKRYQTMTDGCGSAAQIKCCEGLTYKANLIRLNLGGQLRDKQMTMKAFRDMVVFEKKEKALGQYDCDTEPDFSGVLEGFLGRGDIDKVDDDDIYKALLFMTDDLDSRDEGPALKLHKCGHCDKEESMHGDHKKCSRCHQQPYCSKKCQVNDWKIHKQLCGAKNKTNLDSDTLLWIAKTLVKNHSATVQSHSKTKVVLRQRNDATAALVKQLKVMFTGEFSHFNSPTSAGDAGSDPAFSQALADFFAKQPGYEKVWGELRVRYKERLEMERSVKRMTKTLTVPEDVIRDVAKNIARSATISIGSLMCDGDTSANLDAHDKLVDALVDLTKKFVSEHMEYDSYAGLQEMSKDPDFLAEIAVVMSKVYNLKNEEDE